MREASCDQVPLATLALCRHIPRSGAELAAVVSAAGTTMQHAGVASVRAAARQLQCAGLWLADLLSAEPPAPSPKMATVGKAAVKAQKLPTAAGMSRAPAETAARQPKLKVVTPVAVKAAATAAAAKVQPRVAPRAAAAASSIKGPATRSNTTSRKGAFAPSTATRGAAASAFAIHSPSVRGLPAAAGTARPLPGQATGPAFGASAAAAGCLAALALCAMLAVAYWLRWRWGAPASHHEQLDSAGAPQHALREGGTAWQQLRRDGSPSLHRVSCASDTQSSIHMKTLCVVYRTTVKPHPVCR